MLDKLSSNESKIEELHKIHHNLTIENKSLVEACKVNKIYYEEIKAESDISKEEMRKAFNIHTKNLLSFDSFIKLIENEYNQQISNKFIYNNFDNSIFKNNLDNLTNFIFNHTNKLLYSGGNRNSLKQGKCLLCNSMQIGMDVIVGNYTRFICVGCYYKKRI